MDASELEFPFTAAPRMGPGERSRYVPNHRSFGAFMKSEQMRDVTEQAAKDIARRAMQLTPPSNGGHDTRGLHSRVRNGFTVRREAGFLRVAGNIRVMVLVENDVEGSALLEFGARNLHRLRMLGRAGAEFGDFKGPNAPEGI